MKISETPKEGWAGLKNHFKEDAIAGFSVFLLALPLSLGIAKASDFPPLMGLVTAILGGVIVSFISGSRLTIKGPAAGLIVIVAGAVSDFGGGETGWRLACGVIIAASLLQILFGILNLGKLADFFPLPAIHGMLAAIGIIIIAKQIPVMLNVNPSLATGKNPLELLGMIPYFFRNLDLKGALIGIASLVIMMAWPNIKLKSLKRIPAPFMVLLIAIPTALILDFSHTQPPYALVHIGNLYENIRINFDFSGFSQTGIFIKYIVMLSLVGTLESLLTVKAIDMQDPWHRKSDFNKDIIAIGVGNVFAGILGGLPMISEVARSSANVSNGAKTRWANFFHGFFLLVFVLFASRFIEMIPNAALAAMLISVGIKLAHPKEFIHAFKIGKEQLAIFLITIFFTLYEDLLVGILAGILLKIISHLINGVPLNALFKAPTLISFDGNRCLVEIDKAAIFSNFIQIKSRLESIPPGFEVTIDLKNTKLVDHSVMESLEHFKMDYERNGGAVRVIGIENHTAFSDHHLSARKKANNEK